MNKRFFTLWPILFIVLFWIICSAPFLIFGKIPFPGDYLVTFFSPWSQYAQFAQPVKNNAMPDVIDQLYPWKHLVIDTLKQGQIPLWNPYNFAGTPLLANYQSGVLTPLNILFFLFPFRISWGLLILFQPLLAGLSMYLFSRKIGTTQLGGILSAISFMFCGFITCWMGYGTLGYAVAILPLILLGLEGFLQEKNVAYALLVSGGLSFSFFSGHFQMSLYVLLAVCLYFLIRYIPNKNKTNIFIGMLSIMAGVLIAAPQILPSIEFYSQSLRSTIFQRPEIIPWNYLFTIVAPDFFGNPITRNDWFGHYAEWNSYIGLIPFLFAVLSLGQWGKNILVRHFSLLALLSILLATPTFLGDLVLNLHIPVLATSAAGRIIILLSFSLCVLAGIGFDYWIKSPKKYLLGVVGLIFLILGWGIIFGKIGLSPQHLAIAKQNFILPSVFLVIVIISSVCTVVIKQKRFLLILTVLFLLLTSFDMYRFFAKWQTFTSQSLVFPNVGVTNFLKKIPNRRSVGNYGGQVSLYYKIPSLEGYDALYPERYGEFASFIADGAIHPASRSVVDFPKNGKYTKEAINLLGVEYIIHKISDTGKPWAFPVWNYPKDFSIVYEDSNYIVFKNNVSYPRAFLAGDYIVAPDNTKLLSILFSKNLNRRETIVLEKDPHVNKSGQDSSSAVITSYTPNKVTIQTKSSSQKLLFLSDTYFPGWYAFVDGVATPILRADYTFRAVIVGKGSHTVVFSYNPQSFQYGYIGVSLGVVLLGGAYFLQKRRL